MVDIIFLLDTCKAYYYCPVNVDNKILLSTTTFVFLFVENIVISECEFLCFINVDNKECTPRKQKCCCSTETTPRSTRIKLSSS